MKDKYNSHLRQERERRGWSRNYVAERIQVDVITVGRWERGERLPHPVYRQELCMLFEMNAQDLGFFAEQPPDEITTIPERTSEASNTIETSPASLVPDTAPALVNTSLPALTSKKEYQKASALHQRRTILVGLGGLALMTLTGAGLLLTSRPAPHPTIQQPAIENRPSQQLLDTSLTAWINRLNWSPDGQQIATATGVNSVCFWDRDKGAIAGYYTTLNKWVNDISWSQANYIASASADHVSGSIQIWKYPDPTPTMTFQRAYGLRTVSWSPNHTYLAFAGRATTVEVWNPFAPQLVSHYNYPELGSLGTNRVQWSASGTWLACANDDGTVHVWEALTGKLKIIYRKHQGRVIDLAWSPDGQYIASVGVDKTARVWKALTGQTMLVYQGHTGMVEGAYWSPQGKYIVTGSADHTAQVWDAFTGKLHTKYEGFSGTVENVLWSMDGKTIAMATNTQGVEIWQAPQ